MAVYIENPPKLTQNLLKLISEIFKVREYNINIQSIVFLYMSNKQLDTEMKVKCGATGGW